MRKWIAWRLWDIGTFFMKASAKVGKMKLTFEDY